MTKKKEKRDAVAAAAAGRRARAKNIAPNAKFMIDILITPEREREKFICRSPRSLVVDKSERAEVNCSMFFFLFF